MHKFVMYSFDGAALTAAVKPLRAARVHVAACDARWFNPDQVEVADFHLVVPSDDADRDAEFLGVLEAKFGNAAAMLYDAKHEAVKALGAAAKPKVEPDAPKVKAPKAPKAPKADKPDDETSGE